jgi:hypothetical protein
VIQKNNHERNSELNDRTGKKKLNRQLQNIPTNTHRTYFLLVTHWTLIHMRHILEHKPRLQKHKKNEIISCISADNGIKLPTNNMENYRKYTNTCTWNSKVLNNHWVFKEIQEEVKMFPTI